MDRIKARVVELYTGQSQAARRLRYCLILFDLATVVYFIATVPLNTTPTVRFLNLFLATIIAVDFLCRFWISTDRWRHLCRIYVLADLLVLLSLLLDPLLHFNVAFLRILRGIRLGQSEYLLQDLRRDWRFFRLHEDALVAALNLVIFVFVTTSAVFLFFAETERGLSAYVDSLYFTVTTLTTTGFGDLTPQTPTAKLSAVAIMVVGVALFLRLAGTIFSPSRVHHPCPNCGLTRHETDSVHCRHCGALLKIETRGV